IGCGNWGKNHIRVLFELGVLRAVCDFNVETAKAFAQQYHVPARSFDDILADPLIHAVFIATPAATHFEVAKKALNAGKHIFVEKPIALSVIEATEMITLAKQRSCTLMVGHLLQYHSAFLKLKSLKN